MQKQQIMILFLILASPIFILSGESLISQERSSSVFSSAEFIEKIKNNIAQLQVYKRDFNWKEPYKKENQSSCKGSAFFVPEQFVSRKEGYLLTNYHVVAGAECIEAYFPSLGKEPFECEVVAAYPALDCALIQIKKQFFPQLKEFLEGSFSTLSFGNSDALVRLEPVYAIGYPLGADYWKVTTGIFSGISYIDGRIFLQTDAALNPGNSGGALLDSNGNVVGITSAIDRHQYGVADGIGYSIPINDVALIIPRLLNKELIHRLEGSIECAISTAAQDDYFRNSAGGGIYITKVFEGGAAEKWGLEKGDKIYAIKTPDQLYYLDNYGQTLAWYQDKITLYDVWERLVRKNEPLSLMIYRQGVPLEIKANEYVEHVSAIRCIFPEFEPEKTSYLAFGGLVLMELNCYHLDIFKECVNLAHYRYPYNRIKPVVLITHLAGGSVFDRTKELGAGVAVYSINDISVATLEEAKIALQQSKKSGFVKVESLNGCAIVRVSDLLAQEEAVAQNTGYQSASSLLE